MAIEHKITLSTTEPNNNVGNLKIRQSDDETQTLVVTIEGNNLPVDLSGYKSFFMLRTGTTSGIVEQEATLIDAKKGIVNYTLNQYDWQNGGKNFAYFSFRKLLPDNSWKEQFTTRDFGYTVITDIYWRGIKDSNYVWSFEDLLRLLNEFKDSGMEDFNVWFETIKDTLGEDAAGELAIALLDLKDKVGDIQTFVPLEKLQMTINKYASAKKKLTLVKTEYELTETLTIPKDAEIEFSGTTFIRKDGLIFDMIESTDSANIKLSNVTIDGNRFSDNLDVHNNDHRFSGLVLKNVSNSTLRDITINRTVNGEDLQLTPASGMYLTGCKNVDCYNVGGTQNDRSCILISFSERVRFYGSVTFDNEGSGITSREAIKGEYHDILTYNNGFSNLSVNGVDSVITNVISYGSKYSGVNIGHVGYRSDRTTISNCKSFGNVFEGVTIKNSDNILLSNVEAYDNDRNNIYIADDSNATQSVNVITYRSHTGAGMTISGGVNHQIVSLSSYENATHGLYIDKQANASINGNVKCFNNSKKSDVGAGICLNDPYNCKITAAETFDTQDIRTQDSGIWVNAGVGTKLFQNKVRGNKTYDIRQTANPQIEFFFNDSTDRNIWFDIPTTNGWQTSVTSPIKVKRTDIFQASIKGVVENGTSVGNVNVLVLPAGIRPTQTIVNDVPCYNNLVALLGRAKVVIGSNGVATVYGMPTGTTMISFDGVNFYTN